MKKILIIALIVVAVFLLVAGGGLFYLSRGLEKGKNLEINSLDLSGISDGTYNGRFNSGRWTNEVSVTVKNHKITNIDVVKDVTFAKGAWRDELLDRVLKAQDTKVDVVSGATVTSKAYLKAIENALEGGKKQ